MKKLQYFRADLSKLLGVGKIHEMHIETISGVFKDTNGKFIEVKDESVLRIDCEENDEYQTVTGRGTSSKKEQRKKKTEPKKQSGGGVLGSIKEYAMERWRDKTPPDFMTREF